MPGPTQEAKQKPFKCSICPNRFRTKQNRKRHIILVHENAGNFRCSHCDKSFSSRVLMEKHKIAAHTEKKRFRCNVCKTQKFATRFQLRDHHISFHSNERFECDQCGVSYQHRKDLKAHQARHHSAIKRETSGPRCLAGGKDKKAGLKAELSVYRNGSPGVTYSLRTRRKTVNYMDEQEDRVEFDEENESRSMEDGVDETNEPDETEAGDDVPDEEPNKEQDDRTENLQDISPVPHALREHVQDASPMVILSSDEEEDEEENDQDGELAMETSTSSNVTLKLVYDVEYMAPE